jgi:hypothetical protein
MSLRCRWVVVRDGREGKSWQLLFPDGRVLKTIPGGPARALGHHNGVSRPDAIATAAADSKRPTE